MTNGALSAHVLFPDCWNGVDLDSADHKSHMAYSSAGSCPAGWVPIPQLILRLNWTQATSPDPAHARLSSDMPGVANGQGFSLHADFINAWQMTQDTSKHAAYSSVPQLRGLVDLIDTCLKAGLACPEV